MKRPLVAALIFSVALLAGCANHYALHSIQRSEQLDGKASALIALPQDGMFETITYPGSGRQTARAVAAAFTKHLTRVDIMAAAASSTEQLAAARSGGFDYLVTPSIAHWEDRATEWSGRPDRIEIEIRTLRASTGSTVTLGSVEGRSRWATMGGDSPEDMLAEPLDAYVNWLFTAPGTPIPKTVPKSTPAQPTNQRR